MSALISRVKRTLTSEEFEELGRKVIVEAKIMAALKVSMAKMLEKQSAKYKALQTRYNEEYVSRYKSTTVLSSEMIS